MNHSDQIENTNLLSIKNLSKQFGDQIVLNNVSANFSRGKIYALLGPSGSGKSTFLKCINGIVSSDTGEIQFASELESKKNRTGMIFQHFNLFPHLTVLENITLAPKLVLKKPKKECLELAMSLLERVKLSDKYRHSPGQLSGGQKQRVAIARALALEPEILLLDEVTSALDPELVQEVLAIIEELAKEKMTMLIVTHEMSFAQKLASQVLFFDNGKIIENQSADKFFNNPDSIRVKEFLKKIEN